MFRFFFIPILFLHSHFMTFAQSYSPEWKADSARINKWIPGKFNQFNIDAIGNVYVINETGQIKKIDLKGDSSQVYQDVKKWGRPKYLDVSNPLKIRIFYPDFLSIITLDRLLNPRTTLNLRKMNHFRVNGICTSYDNNIWIYDEQLCRILKMDEEGNIRTESADLRNLIDKALSNVRIFDQSGDLFLFDENAGLFIFDYYGAFKKHIPEMAGTQGGVDQDIAFVKVEEKIKFFDIRKGLMSEISVGGIFKNNEAFVIRSGTIYLLKSDGIYKCPLNH